MKSKSTIRRHLNQLRKEAIDVDDPVLRRIAYAMETAVRWATENTVGWDSLLIEAQMQATYLKQEIGLIADPATELRRLAATISEGKPKTSTTWHMQISYDYMVKVDPLPCPFCGKEPTVYEGYSGWHIVCFGCECGPGTARHKRKEEALTVWNERKPKEESSD